MPSTTNDTHSLVEICSACGASNRIPFAHAHQTARCGRCHQPVREPGAPVQVDSASLETLVRNAAVPVVVDFWAAWCGPCRVLAPQLDQVAHRMAGQIVVAKLDVDQNPDAAVRYGAQAIPLIVLFSGGRPIWRETGARPAAQLERAIRDVLTRSAEPRAGTHGWT